MQIKDVKFLLQCNSVWLLSCLLTKNVKIHLSIHLQHRHMKWTFVLRRDEVREGWRKLISKLVPFSEHCGNGPINENEMGRASRMHGKWAGQKWQPRGSSCSCKCSELIWIRIDLLQPMNFQAGRIRRDERLFASQGLYSMWKRWSLHTSSNFKRWKNCTITMSTTECWTYSILNRST